MAALAAEIAKQRGDKKAAHVTELILDKCCSVPRLAGNEFDGFTNLESLSLNAVGLTTLEGFPSLVRLKRLELNDNKLRGGLEVLQDLSLISLSILSLCNNQIQSLDDLEPLGGLPNLKQLDLEQCAVASCDGYRTKVFEMIPQLKVLDHMDINGEEADLEDEDDDEDADEDDDSDPGDDLDDGDVDVDGNDDAEGEGEYSDEGEEGVGGEEEAGEAEAGEEGEEEEAEQGEEGDDEEGDEVEDDDDEDEGEGDDELAAGGKRPRLG